MKTIKLHDDSLEQAINDLPYADHISNDNMIFIPESDYGFAEIYRMYDDIFVFLLPPFGGIPSFHKCYGRRAIKYLVNELREMC